MTRRLTMKTILPPEATVDFTGIETIPAEWRKELPVRGSLSIEEVGLLFELEQQIKNVRRSAELREPMEGAYEIVMGILREKTPELPNLPLDVAAVLSLMAFLAGGEGDIADQVADAIRGSVDDAAPRATEEGDEPRSLGEQHVDPEGEKEAPLPSTKRSRKRSSRSATGSSGRRSGGKRAAGERSEATSRSSQAEVA